MLRYYHLKRAFERIAVISAAPNSALSSLSAYWSYSVYPDNSPLKISANRLTTEAPVREDVKYHLSLPGEDRFGTLQSNQSARKVVKKSSTSGKSNAFEGLHGNNWSKTFGSLSEEWQNEIKLEEKRYLDDEKDNDNDEEMPFVRLSETDRNHPPHWYGRQIAKLGRAGKVYEAIDVLETQMLKEDRVRPTQYVFTVLIGVLGRAGYTKKAFQLFNKMKKFGLEPQAPTYTALFNACSNSPWQEDGLSRAENLRQLMREKDYQPNIMTYRAMIKAYAYCGDMKQAFSLVDEAWEAGLKIDEQCYSFLLMACVTDKEAGLKHAIETWRVMRKRKIKPNTFHYNLLLRVIRDCGLGSDSYAAQLLTGSTSATTVPANQKQRNLSSGYTESEQLNAKKNLNLTKTFPCTNLANSDAAKIESSAPTEFEFKEESLARTELNPKLKTIADLSGKFKTSSELIDERKSERNSLHVRENSDAVPVIPVKSSHDGVSVGDVSIPNLLSPTPHIPEGLTLVTPRNASERLHLLGGLPGLLSHMRRDKAVPDIKTFTLLLESIDQTCKAEEDLMSAMLDHKVKPDSDFMSALIRRRNLRQDYAGAKEVLDLMKQDDLKPTQRTFGCLAMGCATRTDSRELLTVMKEYDVYPNVEIFGILVTKSRHDFFYKLDLLHNIKDYNIRPNKNIIEKLESSIGQAKSIIVKKEQGEIVTDYYTTERFLTGYRRFMQQYGSWLQSVELEPEIHPWAAYRQPKPLTSPLDSLNPPLTKQVTRVERSLRRNKLTENKVEETD